MLPERSLQVDEQSQMLQREQLDSIGEFLTVISQYGFTLASVVMASSLQFLTELQRIYITRPLFSTTEYFSVVGVIYLFIF